MATKKKILSLVGIGDTYVDAAARLFNQINAYGPVTLKNALVTFYNERDAYNPNQFVAVADLVDPIEIEIDGEIAGDVTDLSKEGHAVVATIATPFVIEETEETGGEE